MDWTFDDSDHAKVCTDLEIIEITMQGKVLSRVDAAIQGISEVKEKVVIKFDQINQIPVNWDPHMNL